MALLPLNSQFLTSAWTETRNGRGHSVKPREVVVTDERPARTVRSEANTSGAWMTYAAAYGSGDVRVVHPHQYAEQAVHTPAAHASHLSRWCGLRCSPPRCWLENWSREWEE